MNTVAFKTNIRKWGSSLVVPIPSQIAKRLGITADSPIEVEERNGCIFVTPIRRRRRTLSEILRNCKKNFPEGSPHRAIDFGPAVGNELW